MKRDCGTHKYDQTAYRFKYKLDETTCFIMYFNIAVLHAHLMHIHGTYMFMLDEKTCYYYIVVII